jgi:hypothetical protein
VRKENIEAINITVPGKRLMSYFAFLRRSLNAQVVRERIMTRLAAVVKLSCSPFDFFQIIKLFGEQK